MHRSSYTLAKIAGILSADASLPGENRVIDNLIFDSRKISKPSQSLFFALKGKNDGHRYIEDAYKSGVKSFVVERGREVPQLDEAHYLFVDHVLDALQQLARFHRQQFDLPIIAITGSNGKTVVKEWLHQLLSPDYNIVRSPKSYNSQIGVALSLWQIRPQHNLAIIEAGISKAHEMERLQQMIQPTQGVLTNIGPAHESNFTSREQKTREKLSLFAEVKSLVYSPKYVPEALWPKDPESFTWNVNSPADLNLTGHERLARGTRLLARYKGQEITINIPFHDQAAIENAMTCWSVMLSFGYAQEVIAKRMAGLAAVEMRLELKNGIHNCSIIDDSYSFDLASLDIALSFLKQQNQHEKKTLILSDIPDTGSQEEAAYKTLAFLLSNAGLSRMIGIGDALGKYRTLFPENALFFSDTEQFLEAVSDIPFVNETILLKGGRRFSFEKISQRLTLKTHDTALQINLDAIEHNLKYYQAKLPRETKLMVMVKAYSYGSGSFEIANVLQFNQVDYLAVAYPDEGIALRKAGIQLPIMVMSPDIGAFESLIEYGLEPEIFSIDHLRALIGVLNTRSISSFPIHLKIETGMHRLGIEPADYGELFDLLNKESSVRVSSVFSHFAASGNPEHDDFTRSQIERLKDFTAQLMGQLNYTFLTHIANTAGIERWPEARFDMVRLGIGLYGAGGSEHLLLEPAATLITTVSQIKTIRPEDTVGYNRKGKISGGGTLATVKIGYADGFDRRFGNGIGKMLVGGVLVPTVGDICMDMCMIDVSGLNVQVGDEVVVFGENPRLDHLSEQIGTIPYEIMTGISQRVKRIYFYG